MLKPPAESTISIADKHTAKLRQSYKHDHHLSKLLNETDANERLSQKTAKLLFDSYKFKRRYIAVVNNTQ